jgi:hypothetical protein
VSRVLPIWYVAVMKRFVFVVGIAACGSGQKPSVDTTTTTGTGTGTGTTTADPTPADPAYAARVAYSNPGGMWMPEQMTLPGHLDTFRQLGVTIPSARLADPLADPLASVVAINGCTASFVSPDGLVITNHHCVQRALQHNATPDDNVVENGFLAKTRGDERSAGPNERLYVAQAFTDVTSQMRDGLEKITDAVKRKEDVERRSKEIVAACEKDRPGLRCDVTSFFAGGKYVLIEKLEIRDLRLVYVPRRSVGNYGGEVDNWHWPRHTGDYSFYRAYVGKDGLPADYSPDNEPYHPKHHLTVSTAGVKDRDFVMLLGYPGKTTRTSTAADVQHDVEWYYPYAMEWLRQKYELDEELIAKAGESEAAKATAIKAGVDKQQSQNYMAKFKGILDGLAAAPDMLARKEALDAKIKEWAAQPGHADVKAQIEKYEALRADKRARARVDFDRGKVLLEGSKLLASALSLVRWAEERPKADADRKPGYQDRDMQRAIGTAKGFVRSYDRTLDRRVFKLAMMRALDLPEADRPWLATIVGAKKGAKIDEAAIDKAIEKLYAGTKLESEELRLELLQKGTMKQLKASKDPFIKLAIALWPGVKAQEKLDDAYSGDSVLVASGYATAMREVLGGLLAPDANSTLRITYGTVKSFNPEGTGEENWPFSTAKQILAKNTGEAPFDAPAAELEQIKARNYGPYGVKALGGELPVAFLTDLDITNGSSGSATLDAQGRLVGLAFDGTLAGVASDVVFNSATTRTIHVDIRYILWMMDAVEGADHLLTEMGVEPQI